MGEQNSPTPPSGIARALVWQSTLQEKGFHFNPFGKEVYCTNAFLLPRKIVLCSQLHCHKVLDRNSFDARSVARRSSDPDAKAALTLLWGLLRIPARGSTAASKGHTAIRREEYITHLDGQILVVKP